MLKIRFTKSLAKWLYMRDNPFFVKVSELGPYCFDISISVFCVTGQLVKKQVLPL